VQAALELLPNRHEVLHLADAVPGEEARDQDIGVGEVELLGREVLDARADAPVAPLVPVEDRREHARRVEPRTAIPIDGPVGAHQGDRVQVADQAVLGDRKVVVQAGHPRGV
jgi:hypothetical protein